MPKIKSHSAAVKRFSLTGRNKIKRRHAGAAHILTKKSRKRKKRLASSAIVADCDYSRIRRMLVF
ncbi:MAG: 50S ribosomal protein L35 [Candidatus Cloacimonetes bacterium]|nr:50S ribosomal protein L35 [Candidatus Cloacimonadota bacterium]